MTLPGSALHAMLALRACPWTALARRATATDARVHALHDELDRLKTPWELPQPPGVKPAGEAGATWMPVLGRVTWKESPDVHADPDLLRRWSRGRLREVLHAASVARDARDAAAASFAVARVEAFLASCPPGRCDHWSSGMEIGLRAMRLLHAASRLRQAREAGLGMPSLAPLARALELHEQALESRVDWRLHRTGNHYLVALAARILLASHLPEHPQRAARRRRDLRLFGRELQRQVDPSGIHFESSTHYHLLVAEAVAHVLRSPHEEPAARVAAVGAEMASALAALLRPDGSIASVGDGDDESFVPASLGPDPPPVLRAFEIAQALGAPGPATPQAWGARGLDVLALPGPPAMHVTVSSMGPGRAGTGGHSHDDATTCEVWLDGPLWGHRGTGAYAADRALREALRSARSHAVVQVDDREMNDAHPGHAFRRRHRAHPVREAGGEGDIPWVAIGHHGFAVPAPGAVVRRVVRLDPRRGLVVEDDITGAGSHVLTLRLPWAPGLEPSPPRTMAPNEVELSVVRDGAPLATCRVAAWGASQAPLPFTVEHLPARHWPRQGQSEGAWTTEIRLRADLPVRIRHTACPAAWEPPDSA